MRMAKSSRPESGAAAGPPRKGDPNHEARLVAALRANLRRRKAPEGPAKIRKPSVPPEGEI